MRLIRSEAAKEPRNCRLPIPIAGQLAPALTRSRPEKPEQEAHNLPVQTDTDRDASTSLRHQTRIVALVSLVLFLGLAAFAGSLIWYMPIRFVAHQAGLPKAGPMAADRLSGTIWQGRMQIDGGHEVTWTLRPGASLWMLGLAADWRVEGPGTDLSGKVVLRSDALGLGPLSGVASWPLVAATMPGLPFSCTGQARFAAVELRVESNLRTGSGTVSTPTGECARIDGKGDAVPTPALHAQISTLEDAIQALVTPQDGPRVALVTARLTSADRLVITIHQAGAALVPGMPRTADSELDLPLSILLNM